MTSAWAPPPQEKFESQNKAKKPILILTLGLIVLGGMTFIWYSIRTKTDEVDEANLPVIISDKLPFKVKPDKPGGQVTPHADKTVYELISPHKAEKKPIMMKEEEEEPLRTVAPPEVEPVVAKESIPEPKVQSVGEGSYKVQLASLSSQEAASKEWGKLQKKHGKLLANQEMSIVEATVNGKKVFRVCVGAFSTKEQGNQFWKELAAKGVACLLKKL